MVRVKSSPAKLAREKARYAANREEHIAYQRDYSARNAERVRAVRRKRYEANREKLTAQMRDYHRVNRERILVQARARAYGISIEEARRLRAVKVCDICGCSGNLHIDHDHRTGKVRGVLCRACNHGLGNFADDPDRLTAAILYLAGLL